LRRLERSAQSEEFKQQFHHHLEETEGRSRTSHRHSQRSGPQAGAHEADSDNAIAAEGEKLKGKLSTTN